MAEHAPADYAQLDDGALLSAMREGDECAFVTLYRRRQAGLYRFALRMTGSHAAAEDAVQETFLVLLRHAANYDPARGSVSAFLYGIARHCVLRGLERAGTLLAVSDEEMERRLDAQFADPARDALARAEEVAALRRAILALPEHYREAVVLCDLEEMSYEEAAAAIECPVGTVRSRLHRARVMLGERLRALTAEDAEATEVKAKHGESAPDEVKAGKVARRMSESDGKVIRPARCEA